MTDESIVRPRLQVLSEAQAAGIHRRSLDLLSTVGVRVGHGDLVARGEDFIHALRKD